MVVRLRVGSFRSASEEAVLDGGTEGFGVRWRNQVDSGWAHAIVGGNDGDAEAQGFTNGDGIAIVKRSAHEQIAVGDGAQSDWVRKISPEKDMFRIGLGLNVLAQGRFEASGAGDDEAGLREAVADAGEDINLQIQVVFGFQSSNGQQERRVRVEELFQAVRVGELRGRSNAVRVDEGYAIARDTETVKQIHELGIHGDDPVEAPKDEASEGARARGAAFGRLRVAAGMKREHRPAARYHGAEQGEGQQAKRRESADVEMEKIVTQPEKKAEDGERGFGIVDLVSVGPPRAGEVDYRAGMPTRTQILSDGDQIGLHAAMRWRVGTEL